MQVLAWLGTLPGQEDLLCELDVVRAVVVARYVDSPIPERMRHALVERLHAALYGVPGNLSRFASHCFCQAPSPGQGSGSKIASASSGVRGRAGRDGLPFEESAVSRTHVA